MKKAIAIACAITAASILSQRARGQELDHIPMVAPSSHLKMAQPLMLQQTGVDGVIGTLVVDCRIPEKDSKTYATILRPNGSEEDYTINSEGVPTIDAKPPTGVVPNPDIKKEVIQKLMRELGQRQLNDLSPDNLCRDGRPNVGAALAIMDFVTRRARGLDI